MRTALVSAFLTLFLPLACKDLGTEPPFVYSNDDIREAVFRFQFLHNASGQQQTAAVYFLAVSDSVSDVHSFAYHDPPDAFMRRFTGHTPPVKKLSQCDYSSGRVIDKQTGQSGLIFRLGAVRQTGTMEAEIEGGYWEGNLSASGNRYVVQKIDGQWVVVEYGLVWIS